MKKIVKIILLLSVLISIGGCSRKTQDYTILVNKTNLISEDYINDIEMINITNVYGDEIKVEKQAYNAYLKLHDALINEGIEIGIDSSYRSIEEQQSVMDDFINLYGKDYAMKTVAQPGTSEHHTGLAIDIVIKVNDEWITENEDLLLLKDIFAKIHGILPEYGFILRYPEGKQDITGYDYEPWHIRYVGKQVAYEIYNRSITLEEYLNKL